MRTTGSRGHLRSRAAGALVTSPAPQPRFWRPGSFTGALADNGRSLNRQPSTKPPRPPVRLVGWRTLVGRRLLKGQCTLTGRTADARQRVAQRRCLRRCGTPRSRIAKPVAPWRSQDRSVAPRRPNIAEVAGARCRRFRLRSRQGQRQANAAVRPGRSEKLVSSAAEAPLASQAERNLFRRMAARRPRCRPRSASKACGVVRSQARRRRPRAAPAW